MIEEIPPEVLAKEEAERRLRDEKRQKEKEDRERKIEQDRLAEEKRREEERIRRIDEEKRKKKLEEEWKKLGSDIIQPLPPVPPSFVDDRDPTAVKAWFLNDDASNPTFRTASLKPGKKHGAPPVKLSQLRELGVVYFKVNLNDFSLVNQIVKERFYKHTDEIRISQTCKDEQFLEKWFREHINDDEQIRLITDGSCYYDIRSKQDTWIRLQLNAGDLIVLPPGLYQRASLDEDDYCAMFRIFRDVQRWSPLFRSDKRTDSVAARMQYLKMLKKGNVASDLGFK
jgi:1,2-dihydroxy-3-keto-5-methylthiopentene dioxygenase